MMNNNLITIASSTEIDEEVKRLKKAANDSLIKFRTLYNELMAKDDNENSDYIAESDPISTDEENIVRRPCSCKRLSSRGNNENSTFNRVQNCSISNIAEQLINLNGVEHQNSLTVPKHLYSSRFCNSRSAGELRTNLTFNSRPKITIPEPFSITEENQKRKKAKDLKIAKLKRQLEEEEVKELKVKMRCKPVPRSTHLPIYSQMCKEDEKRKKERKTKCQDFLQSNFKEFKLSCLSRTRSKSMDCITSKNDKCFKAKPAPKSVLSSNITDKIKVAEAKRKTLIALRAHETLKDSLSPITQKLIGRSYSMLNLYISESKIVSKTPKPNIDEITKRLYTKKCKETLDTWDNKVNQCTLPQTKNIKTVSTNEKMYPFFEFPVRMSSGQALRQKQIRSEIDARKKKEEEERQKKDYALKRRKDIERKILSRLKSADTTIDPMIEIAENMRSFKMSQLQREQEYKSELEEMMKRVSENLLLVERQDKKKMDARGKSDKHNQFMHSKSSENVSLATNDSANEEFSESKKLDSSEELADIAALEEQISDSDSDEQVSKSPDKFDHLSAELSDASSILLSDE